ncbi:MAG: 5-formyltetrahydrofolate cyclo-ligase [Thermodesulfobacteriota bacterium]
MKEIFLIEDERKALRRRILALRDGLDPVRRRAKSARIHDRLLAMAELGRMHRVMIYASFRSEVETWPLFDLFGERGIAVCVPLTLAAEHKLLPCLISDPCRDLQPGFQGIFEPAGDRLRPFDPTALDAVLVPGSVFDNHGGRLGYGGGYYDRFLADAAPQALRIGLAFELQVVQQLPLLAHDQPLHYLVTEKTIRMTAQ